MASFPEEPSLPHLFRLLGNPINLGLIESLGNRKYTLPGLCKRHDKTKSHLCMYLSDLYRWGFIDKAVENGKMRYWLRARAVKGLVRKGYKVLGDLFADDDPPEEGEETVQ
jgi:hypothetical protein